MSAAGPTASVRGYAALALGVALACSSSGGEQSGPASDTASTTAGSDTASTTASSGTGEDGCILKGEDPGERPCVAADLTTEEIVEGGRGFAKSRTWDFFQGDVNGDGIKDLAVADEAGYHFALRPPLLVGEPAIDVDAILAGVGGFSISIAGFADTLLLSQRSGDVNGDGRDDVLLIYKEGSIVIVFVLFSPGVGAPIDVETIGTTTPGLRLELADTGAGWYNLAHSGGVDLVTEVVDLSGDGRAEILVGGQTLVGMDDSWRGFAVFPGRADTALLSLDSPGVLYRTGLGPAAAADLDGDGAPELVVSRNGCSAGCWDNLQVEVLHAPFEVADADGRIDLAEHIGVGDIDGDGRDDILYCDFHESCGDRGGVVFGRAWPAVVGASSPCASGFSVSRAWGSVFMAPIGDVNGDGRDDLLVGGRAPEEGPVFVMFGKTNTLPVHGDLALVGASGYGIRGSTAHGTIRSEGGYWERPSWAGPVGDLNGDGLGDFWVRTDHPDHDLVVFGAQCPGP